MGQLPLGEVIEFNQLKFTFRQLYGVTAGLEIRFNDLGLHKYSEHDKLIEDKLACLMRLVDVTKRHWLDGVCITLAIEHELWCEAFAIYLIKDEKDMFRKLHDFYRANPSMNLESFLSSINTL
jgi:hypothetical protein